MTTSPVAHLRLHPVSHSWWLALGVSNIGTWMQVIGISLLALRLPGLPALNLSHEQVHQQWLSEVLYPEHRQ
ncbi:hypothetical protein [Deinococcus sp. UYEF24]